jgi:hypothetical protein
LQARQVRQLTAKNGKPAISNPKSKIKRGGLKPDGREQRLVVSPNHD